MTSANGWRVFGIDQDHLARAVETVEDFQMHECGDVFGDGLPGQPFTLLIEDHHGHAGERFGHGVRAEDSVLGHGDALFHVTLAVGAVIDNLAVAGQDGDSSGELLLVDFVLDHRMEVLKPVAGEADGLGFGCWQIGRGAKGNRLQG